MTDFSSLDFEALHAYLFQEANKGSKFYNVEPEGFNREALSNLFYDFGIISDVSVLDYHVCLGKVEECITILVETGILIAHCKSNRTGSPVGVFEVASTQRVK